MDENVSQLILVYNLEKETVCRNPLDLIAIQDTARTTGCLFTSLEKLGFPTVLLPVEDSLPDFSRQLRNYAPDKSLVFFNVDGFMGNNAAASLVAQLIEDLGFEHTGSEARSISRSIYKAETKKYLNLANVPTPDYQVFETTPDDCHLRFPLIVKPICEDASMGIHRQSVVTDFASLREQVRAVVETYNEPALVEEFIGGREISVSIWGNAEIEILPLTEMDYSAIDDPLQRLLTYDSKWQTDSYAYRHISTRCPALVTPEEQACIHAAARGAYRAIGLRDFGRVDMRFENGIPYVIDVNELPDLAPESGFPTAVRNAGFTYDEMVKRIVTLACERMG